MIIWDEWPLWLVICWQRYFQGCSSGWWTHHPTPRVQRRKRWWPA